MNEYLGWEGAESMSTVLEVYDADQNGWEHCGYGYMMQ